MKKLAISTLAVLIACPAFAAMGDNGGSTWQMWGLDPYIGLRGGLAFNNLNYSHNDKKHSIEDMTYQGRAALGLEMCRKGRTEIEWSIYSKAKDDKNFNGEQLKVENKLQTLLFNAYWEFGDYKVIRPFAGIGAGLGFAKVTARGEDYDYSKDKTRFSAMGTAGLTFDMERFAVDIAARYNYVNVASGLHNIGGDIGVRFMF